MPGQTSVHEEKLPFAVGVSESANFARFGDLLSGRFSSGSRVRPEPMDGARGGHAVPDRDRFAGRDAHANSNSDTGDDFHCNIDSRHRRNDVRCRLHIAAGR